MTVIVTVNVESRYRGFLASAMLEIAPGVYTSPNMTSGIRDRIWEVADRLVFPTRPRVNSNDVAGPVGGKWAGDTDVGRGAERDS